MERPHKAHSNSLLLSSEIFENLSLHLEDVEFLRNAYVVQAVTAPLVRYSNRGRYEPYAAQSWVQIGNTWTFQIREGLTCEDGQKITAQSFADSLKKSILRFGKNEILETPFAHLEGLDQLQNPNNGSLLGVSHSESSLHLHFKKKVGKSLLEYLAMTPFAFLCSSNFDSQGKWISLNTFVSSGPYRIEEFDQKKGHYKLKIRKNWPLNSVDSFDVVYLSKENKPDLNATSYINMTFGLPKTSSRRKASIHEVPRALVSLRLGIEDEKYFSNSHARQTLRAEVRKILSTIDVPFENYHVAESFFFGQVSGHEDNTVSLTSVTAPTEPLKVRARKPGERPEIDFYQSILFHALDRLKWKYTLEDGGPQSAKEYFEFSYDIAFDRSHVDATLDPEFVRILFKSKLGPKYQDPGGRISSLVDQYDSGNLAYRDFLIDFNAIISQEAAVIPLFHRGFVWTFSPNIDLGSASPLMSVLRYEELKSIKDDSN